MTCKRYIQYEDEFLDDPRERIGCYETTSSAFEDFQTIDAEIIDYGICEEEYEQSSMTPESPPRPTQRSVTTTNLSDINKIKPLYVKLVDCDKYPWYYPKIDKLKLEAKCVANVKYVTNSSIVGSTESSTSVGLNELSEYPVIVIDDDSEDNAIKEDLRKSTLEKKKAKKKNKHYDYSKYNMELRKALSQRNLTEVDYKKNKGLVGLKIQRVFEDETSKACNALKGKVRKTKKKVPKNIARQLSQHCVKAADKTLDTTETVSDQNQIQNKTTDIKEDEREQNDTFSMDKYPEKSVCFDWRINVPSPKIPEDTQNNKPIKKNFAVKEKYQNINNNIMQNADCSTNVEIIVDHNETKFSNPLEYPFPMSSRCKVDEKICDNNFKEFLTKKVTKHKQIPNSNKFERGKKSIKSTNDSNIVNQRNKKDPKENTIATKSSELCASNKCFTVMNKFTQKVFDKIIEKNPNVVPKTSNKENSKKKNIISKVPDELLVTITKNKPKPDKRKAMPTPSVSITAIKHNDFSTTYKHINDTISGHKNEVKVSTTQKDNVFSVFGNQNKDIAPNCSKNSSTVNNAHKSDCFENVPKDNNNKRKMYKLNTVANNTVDIDTNSTAVSKIISEMPSRSSAVSSLSHKKSKKKNIPNPPISQFSKLQKVVPCQTYSKRKQPVNRVSINNNRNIENYTKIREINNTLLAQQTQEIPNAQQNCLENIHDNSINKETVITRVPIPTQQALKPQPDTIQNLKNTENLWRVTKVSNRITNSQHNSDQNISHYYKINAVNKEKVHSMPTEPPQQPSRPQQDQLPIPTIITGSNQRSSNNIRKEHNINILKKTLTHQNTPISALLIRPQAPYTAMSSAPIETEAMQPFTSRPGVQANVARPPVTHPSIPNPLLTVRHQLPLQQVSPVRKNLYQQQNYLSPTYYYDTQTMNMAPPQRNNSVQQNLMYRPVYTGQNNPPMLSKGDTPLLNYDLDDRNVYWPYNNYYVIPPPPPPPPALDLPKYVDYTSVIGINKNEYVKKISVSAPTASNLADTEIDSKKDKANQELPLINEKLTPGFTKPISLKTEMM